MRLPSLLGLAAGIGLPATLLFAAPATHAASTLKVPVPQSGQVSVATAKSSKAAKLRVAGTLPDGVVALGGVAGKGTTRRAVVALVRPSGGRGIPAGSVTFRAAGAALSGPAVLRNALTATGASFGAACSAAPKALGTIVGRRGASSLTSADARRIGALVAGALCGTPLDAAARAALSREGLAVRGVPAGPGAPAKPASPTPGGAPPAGPGAGAPLGTTPPGTTPPGTTPPGTTPPGTTPPGTTPPGTTPPSGGVPACSNGADDDGDGQIDHVDSAHAFVDPGCLGATDASEDSEKTLPKGCGLGAYTKDSRQGFGVDFDSLSFDHCPKNMTRGVVDLAVPATSCADVRWTGTPGGSCTISPAGNVVVIGPGGNQWDVTGKAAQSLCATQAQLYAWTRDGTAYEQKMPVFDGAEVCAEKPAAPQCSNGIDDDGDEQVDTGATAGKRADPGCDGPADASEAGEEIGFGEGCVAIVAFDPAQPRFAYPMLLPRDEGDSCPTITAAWVELADGLDITECQSYYGGVLAGTCTTAQGGLVSAGAAGTRWGADVVLDADASCALIGRLAIRLADGRVREGATLTYRIVGQGIERC